MRLSLACAKRAPAQTSHEFWTASRERLGGLEGDSSLSSRLSIYVYGQNLDYGVMRNLDYPPPEKVARLGGECHPKLGLPLPALRGFVAQLDHSDSAASDRLGGLEGEYLSIAFIFLLYSVPSCELGRLRFANWGPGSSGGASRRGGPDSVSRTHPQPECDIPAHVPVERLGFRSLFVAYGLSSSCACGFLWHDKHMPPRGVPLRSVRPPRWILIAQKTNPRPHPWG